METTNYGHLSRQLKVTMDRANACVDQNIGNDGKPYAYASMAGAFAATIKDTNSDIRHLIPEINRLDRIVSALESIGVNLDETDIEALEWIADLHNTHSERSCLRDQINKATMDAGGDVRDYEQEQAIESLTSGGFVLNDDDGETWTRGNETVKIELTNGRESRYKWELARCANPFDLVDSGVSGEFHRLLKLIAPVDSVSACGGSPSGEPCNTTEVSI